MTYINKYYKYKTKYLQLMHYNTQFRGKPIFDDLKIIYVTDKIQIQKLSPWVDDDTFNKFPNSTYCFLYCHKSQCNLDNNSIGNSNDYDDDYILIGQMSLQTGNDHDIHSTLFEPLGNRTYIWGLGLFPEFRSKGYGSAMLRLVLKDDVEYILQVNKSNEIAIKLYTKFGFVNYKPNKLYKQNNKRAIKQLGKDRLVMVRHAISTQ